MGARKHSALRKRRRLWVSQYIFMSRAERAAPQKWLVLPYPHKPDIFEEYRQKTAEAK